MKVKDHKDGKLVILSTALGTRSKMLYLLYFVLVFLAGGGFVTLGRPYDSLSSYWVLIPALLFFFLSYRLANRAMMVELLFVNASELCLIKQGLFSKKERRFELTAVTRIYHLDQQEDTIPQHPLEGKTVDYLGYRQQGRLIQESYGTDRVAFDYNGRTIKFGEHVYSWEFEELEALITEFGYQPQRNHENRVL
jgi:hypothetical protein